MIEKEELELEIEELNTIRCKIETIILPHIVTS